MAKNKSSLNNLTTGLFSTSSKDSNNIDIEKKINTEDISKTKSKKPSSKKSELIQRAYYIREEQYKKLRFLAVEQDTDASSIVRQALDLFFER